MSSRRLREGFVKPSRCLHEAFTRWARRGASAKGSRRLHERFMKTSRALKASRSLREGFAKASRRLQPYPRRLLEGFAKAPRAPPFGNDSSDNDKPPAMVSFWHSKAVSRASGNSGSRDMYRESKKKDAPFHPRRQLTVAGGGERCTRNSC